MNLTVKDALELYENGKHRRYTLLFSVNGGAFAVASLIAEGKQGGVVGGLSLTELSIGMVVFTVIMVWDIFEFGRRSRKEPIAEVFGTPGRLVLFSIGLLICAGWLRAGLAMPAR